MGKQRHTKAKNYFFPTVMTPGNNPATKVNPANGRNTSPEAIKRNLSNVIAPVQLALLKQDVKMWREAKIEATLAWYPHRVRMQRLFLDTMENGHVWSCVERRKDLTRLRKYEFIDESETANDDMAKVFKNMTWFKDFISFTIDAILYGYSLISLGDIVNDKMKDCSLVRRWNVSPDRFQVSSYIYSLSGPDWREPPFEQWHVYVPTTSEDGVSPCGYGLLYKVALYEIFMRNLLGYNGDFVELYAQPYRVAKTSKTTESERGELEEAVKNMGSNGWAIIDPLDEIAFLETALGGTGWQGYDNLESRCMKTISKLILGHADAMDSTPGKLGAGQDGETSPVTQAMNDKQTKDGEFVEGIINEQLLPRLRDLGFDIPEGITFRYKNDAEKEEFRAREDKSNMVTAQIAGEMKKAGLKMDAKYFEDRTGIPTEDAPEPEPVGAGGTEPDENDIAKAQKVKAKMNKLYGRRR